jgi:hypothetical protein
MSVALSPITIIITNIIRTSFLFIDLGLVLLVKINASGIRFRDARIISLAFEHHLEVKVLVKAISSPTFLFHETQNI